MCQILSEKKYSKEIALLLFHVGKVCLSASKFNFRKIALEERITTSISMDVCMYVCISMYVCMYVYTSVCLYECTYVCTYGVCRPYMYLCACMYVWRLCMHAYVRVSKCVCM